MRYGENALATIEAVKTKLEELKAGLPEGVEIVPTYDRSQLIENSVDNLLHKVLEEMVVVSIVCLLFLLHARSTLVAVITLPLSILIAFIVMNKMGVNANIMSLGGIAIAIGAVVDGAIVMIENMHKHLEHFKQDHQRQPDAKEHWKIVAEASIEVGPALFFSLLIITLSFVPVFALEAQEGRLFSLWLIPKPLPWPPRCVVDHLGAYPDGLLYPRQDPLGKQQPTEPGIDSHLQTYAQCRAALPQVDPAGGSGGAGQCLVSGESYGSEFMPSSRKGISCTCQQPCLASVPARPPKCCSKPTG